MDHPDFRVRGKVFATLGPDLTWGMVKLTPDQQEGFVHAEPEVFRPAHGAWGAKGATLVTLRRARVGSVRQALAIAWRNTAPAALVRAHRSD
jgi:hypothetical protein